jgi:Ser/Thr protein kinase RdoA (MazF antagonist)
MTVEKQLADKYGLHGATCRNLHALANDTFEVIASEKKFALKLYNPNSRNKSEVDWELRLTHHLIDSGVPVARPIKSKVSYVETFVYEGEDRTAVLFEWAQGEKPKPSRNTYLLLGQSAALIHQSSDTFTQPLSRDNYDSTKLIDEQLMRMKEYLEEVGEYNRLFDLGERLKVVMANPDLDTGVCHMDLTLDNVYIHEGAMTVFDLDSAGYSWRAIEPHGVLLFSEEYFQEWLEGYRKIREFNSANEKAVAAFAVIGQIRNIAWKLGVANSSRGKPLITAAELPPIIDGWLEWERTHNFK